ncbi:ribbon-helix-helix protein, CopG family [Cnuibacter physcomitrellae]|uniref:ribbon-helix-helix protein, CopG family n=1 Tax=Cnuibacter physcomitrellae TaxID=1619308 RepID=UPI0021757E7C|nr:ribbon-helix-helix protein, CopG family [Cnuibacter physcomitrellae]MCS5497630.1 ribbon-helix-helix protein, CopG family [Cnuibacter physcomitrellae]
MDPNKYVVTENTPIIDGDADLEGNEYRYADGTRITEENTEAYTVERKRAGGRPSLGAARGTSPSVNFRLPAKLREEAEELARREGRGLSVIAREALEQYIVSHRAS